MPENNAANQKVRLNRSSATFIVDYISELEICRRRILHLYIAEREMLYIEQEVHPVKKYDFPFEGRICWGLR